MRSITAGSTATAMNFKLRQEQQIYALLAEGAFGMSFKYNRDRQQLAGWSPSTPEANFLDSGRSTL